MPAGRAHASWAPSFVSFPLSRRLYSVLHDAGGDSQGGGIQCLFTHSAVLLLIGFYSIGGNQGNLSPSGARAFIGPQAPICSPPTVFCLVSSAATLIKSLERNNDTGARQTNFIFSRTTTPRPSHTHSPTPIHHHASLSQPQKPLTSPTIPRTRTVALILLPRIFSWDKHTSLPATTLSIHHPSHPQP